MAPGERLRVSGAMTMRLASCRSPAVVGSKREGIGAFGKTRRGANQKRQRKSKWKGLLRLGDKGMW